MGPKIGQGHLELNSGLRPCLHLGFELGSIMAQCCELIIDYYDFGPDPGSSRVINCPVEDHSRHRRLTIIVINSLLVLLSYPGSRRFVGNRLRSSREELFHQPSLSYD